MIRSGQNIDGLQCSDARQKQTPLWLFFLRLESAPAPGVPLVTAMCYSQTEDVLLAAYESGLVEIWLHDTVAGHKQVNSRPLSLLSSFIASGVPLAP